MLTKFRESTKASELFCNIKLKKLFIKQWYEKI